MITIDSILPTIENLGVWNYWIIFAIAFFESLALVGAFIPGTLFVVTVGFVASQGYLGIIDLMWFVSIGAILGDCASYYLGTKGERFFKNENRILKASHLDTSKEFFAKHGSKSIFIGRFISVIRPVIAFTAGISRMNLRTFLFWNVTSGLIWAIGYLLIGYFFGGAFAVIEATIGRASIVVVGVCIIAWLIYRHIKSPKRSFLP
jgi:undecaprenyl-diphosphatase